MHELNNTMSDTTLLTNFSASEEEEYQQAIEEYGDPDIRIEDAAYNIYGYRLPHAKSLHYYGSKVSLSDFWVIFNRIHNSTPHWYD